MAEKLNKNTDDDKLKNIKNKNETIILFFMNNSLFWKNILKLNSKYKTFYI